MKKIRLFSLIGLVMVGTSSFADEDQFLSLRVLEQHSFTPNSRIADECKILNQGLKDRISSYVALNGAEINSDQINGTTSYSMKKVTHGRGSVDYVHSCDLKIRLTQDAKRISVSESNMRYSGSGRIAACEEMKKEIDQSAKVIFSQIENNLVRCLVSPIVSIENK